MDWNLCAFGGLMSCMEVACMILDAVLPAVLLMNNKSQMNVFACLIRA